MATEDTHTVFFSLFAHRFHYFRSVDIMTKQGGFIIGPALTPTPQPGLATNEVG